LPSQVANALIRIVSRIPVHDCGCGLKAYRREVLEGRYVPKGFMNRFSPAALGVNGEEFAEVEIIDRERRAGQSHYGMFRVFEVVRDLATLPFAVRDTQKWLRRFRWMEWMFLCAAILLALLKWWLAALAALLLGLASSSNARNLERFVEAQANPPFRVKEFR
jgi:hypothetical protein